MYDKQEIINYIKLTAYKTYIDKKFIQEKFNCSEKTSERIISSIKYKHMKQPLIEMMKDIELGMHSSEVALKYNCSVVNVNAFMRRHGIKRCFTLTHLPRNLDYRLKNYSDINYFNKIDSSDKAYILGFIAADGCVTHKEIRIALHSKDKDILEKFIIIIGLKNKSVKTRLQNNSFNNKLSPISCISFGTKEMRKDLNELGFDNRKTASLKFPNIDKKYYLDFIRGYCDGDGSFTKDKNNRYSFSLEGTKSFLIYIKEFFEKEYDIKFSTNLYKRFNTESCCYTLRATGKNNVIKILDLLYNKSNLYLDRKYNKYLEITKM